jgi:hypothetical protein
VPVLARPHTSDPQKRAPHCAATPKTSAGRNLVDALNAFFEIAFRSRNADAIQKFSWRNLKVPVEHTREVPGAHVDTLRHLLDQDFFLQVLHNPRIEPIPRGPGWQRLESFGYPRSGH